MEYDYYKVYLGTDMDGYRGPFMCESLDKVEFLLNHADMYEKYLVVAHNNSQDMDDPIAQGEITVNKKRRR